MKNGGGPGKVFVIGAGLAGLSSAVALAGRGIPVELIEGAAQAGGRCRSYHDPVLDMTIDNGNHLVLSGNHATWRYLGMIGAQDRLTGPAEAAFSFVDLRGGDRWRIRPNAGPLAWWVFDPRRRTPGTTVLDHLRLVALLGPQGGRRVDQAIACQGPLWDRLMAPLLLAALNTDPAGASAALAGAVIGETLARGGRAYLPRIAQGGLSAAFVDPALAFLASRGAVVRLGQRVRGLRFEGARADTIELATGAIVLGAGDAMILATPPWVSQALVPGLTAPDRFSAIVNAHFGFAPPPGATPMVGVIGAAAQWIFAFPERISVTVSAADALLETDREALARRLWRDVAAVHELDAALPAWQIVKERRATFAATPDQDAKRPPARTALSNLILAGDWTMTGLPATIEGAIRSGDTAAHLATASR